MPGQPVPSESATGLSAAGLGLNRRIASVAWTFTSSPTGDEDAPEVALPEFYMPFAARCNPNLDSERPRVKEWAAQMGMLGSGLTGWDEPGFESADPPRFAALVHPDAPGPKFELAARWITTLYFLADFFEQVFQNRRDLVGATAAFDRLPAFMPISRPEAVPIPLNPLERAVADLWPRTAPQMSKDWRRWFSQAIQRACEALVWKILNLIENRIPDPVDYIGNAPPGWWWGNSSIPGSLYLGSEPSTRNTECRTDASADRNGLRLAGL